MKLLKIAFTITCIWILIACSSKETNELFRSHLEYFDLIDLQSYDEYDLIMIVDSQGCESCLVSAVEKIQVLGRKYKILVIDLGGNKNLSLSEVEVYSDPGRKYFSFPFSFDGLTMVDIKSEMVYYPLFEETPLL